MAIEPVWLGVSGFAYTAPVGTTAPTTPFDAWGAGWTNLGDITDNGLVESLGQNRTTVNAWGHNAPVRTQVKQRVSTYKLGLLNITAQALGLYYSVALGDMVSSGSGDTQFLSFADPNTTDPQEMALGFDVLDGDRHTRFLIARAEVTDTGDLTYKDDVPVAFELTFTALTPSGGGTAIQRMYAGVALPA